MLDVAPHPDPAGSIDMRDVTRSVAAEMSAIVAPMAVAAPVRPDRPAMRSVLRRRSHLRPLGRTVFVSLLGAAVLGLAGAAYVAQPARHDAPVVARATPVAAPRAVAAVAIADPEAEPAPPPVAKAPVAETTAPVAPPHAAVPLHKASATRWARGARRENAHGARREEICGRACLRRSELDAHERLRSAYLAAADAGVSNRDLADYRREWIRLTRAWSHQPARLIAGYGQLADELDQVAQEVRSGEPD